MKPKSAIKNLALATALGLAISFTAHAATVTKAPTGTDLTAGASWGGTVPTATDTATWTATSLGAGLTFGSDASWQGIAVTGAASAIDITGAGTLTLGAGGIDLAAVDLSIQNGIALGSQTSTTFLTLSNQTLFTNTPLASVVSVTGKMGGAWVNSGIPLNAAGYQFANNGTTATCWFKVADGGFTKGVKIELSQSGADIQARALQAKYISGTNFAFNFDTGGTVGTVATSQDAGGYGGHTTTINLTNPYTGTVSLSGTNSYDGATTVASGTLAVAGGNAIPDASALSISVGTSLLLNSSETVGSLAGAGTADLQGNTLTAGGDQSSTTFAGTLAGTGGSLVKAGTGTLTLTGTGSLTGGAVVSQGTLLLNNPTSLGTLGSVTLNDANTGAENAALIAQTTSTGDFVFTRPITVTNQGSGITTIGTNRTGAGRTFIDGEITLNKDVTLSGTLGDRTMYRGGIRGTGNVTINGGSRTTFGDDVAAQENSEGASIYDFTGNLTLTGTGTMLQYNSNIELTHVGTVTVETSATMRSAYGKSLSINALAGSGTVTSVAGSGTLVIGIANGGDTFSGVISGTGGDALKLAKAGSGTQILTGTNTYTGATTINGGTLKLGTGGSINGTTSITVAPGATFDAADTGFTLGAGKILSAGDSAPGNDVTGAVVSEGTIRPGGNGTLGTLTGITNLTLGGTLDWDRSANSTEADNIVINGTLTISPGFNLNPAAIGFPSAGTRTYTLVSGLTSPLTQT
ncbi:MAG: autotransporter-associated beta strand repeat-containing protein, partial [Akkermansiaceae bacterium]|nr:autotransporter-associated beta strand repeat-containing protein [Akkermansiaceae bacterium]